MPLIYLQIHSNIAGLLNWDLCRLQVSSNHELHGFSNVSASR